MPPFRVSSRIHGSVDVEAANWLVAMGLGLDHLGVGASPDRLACERLLNGTVLVRDVRSGEGYSVQPLDGPAPATEPSEEALELPGEAYGPDPDFETEDVAPTPHVVRVAAESIAAAVDLDAALGLAVSAGVRVARARGGSALVREGDSLRFRFVVGEHAERLRGMRIPVHAGVAGFSVAHGAALVVNDAYADPRFYRNVDRHTGHRTRALVCAPVGVGRACLGCIEMVNPLADGGFSDDDLAEVVFLATAVANRAAALAATSP